MKISPDKRLWFLVGLAFALLLGAWATLFTIAAKNPIASVPLAGAASDPGSAGTK